MFAQNLDSTFVGEHPKECLCGRGEGGGLHARPPGARQGHRADRQVLGRHGQAARPEVIQVQAVDAGHVHKSDSSEVYKDDSSEERRGFAEVFIEDRDSGEGRGEPRAPGTLSSAVVIKRSDETFDFFSIIS